VERRRERKGGGRYSREEEIGKRGKVGKVGKWRSGRRKFTGGKKEE